MKKVYVYITFVSAVFCLLLTGCSLKGSQSSNQKEIQNSPSSSVKADDIQKSDELNNQLKQYKSFLLDEICSESKSNGRWKLSRFCNIVVPGKTKDGIKYALFDMTGDGMPELHVLTDISYSIHTIENNQLITWYEGDRYQRPLNNRAILEEVHNYHGYLILDNTGEKVFSCAFTEGNQYMFTTGGDYIKLSKSKWDKLIKPFLTIGSDKIKWKNIENLDF